MGGSMDGSWVASTAFTVRVLARRTEAPAAVIGAGLVCEPPFFYIHMSCVRFFGKRLCLLWEYPHLPYQPLLSFPIQLRAFCFALPFEGNCILLNFIGSVEA
jgi:hypothetical protein